MAADTPTNIWSKTETNIIIITDVQISEILWRKIITEQKETKLRISSLLHEWYIYNI